MTASLICLVKQTFLLISAYYLFSGLGRMQADPRGNMILVLLQSAEVFFQTDKK